MTYIFLQQSATWEAISALPMASDIESFLHPLSVDISKIHRLARAFSLTFANLAAFSQDQFLPTPISDSVLRPEGDEKGR